MVMEYNIISIHKWVQCILTNINIGVVDQVVKVVKESEHIILHIPPSGTRKYTDHWRSGFYHIAYQAQIPIFPAWLDGKYVIYTHATIVKRIALSCTLYLRSHNMHVYLLYCVASTKTFGYNSPITLTGNMKLDMDTIRNVYKDKRGIPPYLYFYPIYKPSVMSYL